MSDFGFSTNHDIAKREQKLDVLKKIRSIKKTITNLEKMASALYDDSEPYVGPKIAVYGGTEDCYKDMVRSAKTLLANSHIDKIYFLIDSDEFIEPLPNIIETIDTRNQPYFFPWAPRDESYENHIAVMRHSLYDMFPQYERVLWLDSNTLILDNISDIFKCKLGDFYYFAAVEENRHYLQYTSTRKVVDTYRAYHDVLLNNCRYFNAGVLLENLKLLRDEGIGERLVNRLNNYNTFYSSQTVINEMFRDRILSLDYEWNSGNDTDEAEMPRIINLPKKNLAQAYKNIISMYDNISFDELIEWREKRKKAGILNGKILD